MRKRFLEWLKKGKRRRFITWLSSCLLPDCHVHIHRTRTRKEKSNILGEVIKRMSDAVQANKNSDL